ncbi:MAG: nucleotidyltransferase domain-containing protein [Brevinematales bacterium]|nr:nucleotidyltransferase domain-containing protein [Brevinematales bacterium]
MKFSENSIPAIFKKYLDELKIPYEKVYLFGSRSRDSWKPDSDYDFFIVLKRDYSKEERNRMYAVISEKIHSSIKHTSFDIKLRNKSYFEKYIHELNYLDNTVVTEGKML